MSLLESLFIVAGFLLFYCAGYLEGKRSATEDYRLKLLLIESEVFRTEQERLMKEKESK